MLHSVLLKARKTQRSRCRIDTRVRYFNERTEGRVLDLSAVGLAIELTRPISARSGSRIFIESRELGLVEGTVQWCRGTRLGIEFDRNSNVGAKVASYFRFYHKPAPRPVRP